MTRKSYTLGVILWALVIAAALFASPQKGGFVSSSNSLRNGLIVWWDLDEASGNRAASYSGYTSALTLTDVNSVASATGKLGLAADYVAASTEALSIASNSALQAGDIEFTIAGWMYLTDKTNARALVCKNRDVEYQVYYEDFNDRFLFEVTADGTGGTYGGVAANTFGSPSLNTWYFIVAQYDPATDELSISVNNGAVDTSSHAGGIFAGSGTFYVGSMDGTAYGSMDGRIDLVGVWKRKITAAEIAYLYNSGNGRSPLN
jgi:hypothetical protein